ncbi:carboxypeptidase Taq [Sporobacter termitidis DSM 10068]|uniref:Metal-dependent carboxypeptidase n=1 Tax=Sporobacter termitidis DSM 10068 TaxID=1123282 RepID=A0A1M5XGE3_9FIRM|nr:carboxypeptidase M32 [Sporobacter termitidis]SHH98712.1 carboxypeptidase Taq [Sporobacter termitidis DSM 10068]
MELATALEELAALQKEYFAFQYAEGILYYDSVTGAPEGSTQGRGEAMAILSGRDFEILASPHVGALLDFLQTRQAELSELQNAQVRVIRREYDQISKVPKHEYTAYAALINEATAVWHRSKQENDYASFAPYIDRIVGTMIRFAGYYAPGKDAYDVWLDHHERGMTKEKLETFFGGLRRTIVPLLQRITDKGAQPDNGFLFREYPVEKQRALSDALMQVLTIDRRYCAIAETEHPFTTEFTKHDVRITTKYLPDNLAGAMYSTIHEGGHALYELHTGDELMYTFLGHGTSMGIHESQSRFFENMVGRSEAFVQAIYPKLSALFPAQLKDVDAHRFWLAVNRAEPSLIRTEADELTYSLHVMVRFEIEKKLFAGEIIAKDIPALWASLMKDYLGVDVPDDRRGALQDSHWSGGSFGYFPSYAVGSAYAAQFYAAMGRELDIEAAVRSGDLSPLARWLEQKIWRFGAAKEPDELLLSATGAPFDPKYYLSYLTDKFRRVYGLDGAW